MMFLLSFQLIWFKGPMMYICCSLFQLIWFKGPMIYVVPFFQLIWFQGPMRRLSTDDELLLEGRENRLILSIETMKERYFSNFTCQADNELGRSSATIPISGIISFPRICLYKLILEYPKLSLPSKTIPSLFRSSSNVSKLSN
jgi:hypothetical protein